MTEEIKNLIKGIGAMSEMYKLVYDSLKTQGFDNKLCIEFTKHQIEMIIAQGKNQGPTKDGLAKNS